MRVLFLPVDGERIWLPAMASEEVILQGGCLGRKIVFNRGEGTETQFCMGHWVTDEDVDVKIAQLENEIESLKINRDYLFPDYDAV